MFDLHQTITDQIIAMLEQGMVPWRNPILGRGQAGMPRNLASGKTYRGVNVFLLAFTAWAKGYGSAHWLTFNQAKEKGGGVRKGEKASLVVFWKLYETTDKRTGEATTVPVLKHYNVFNAEQCDGVPVPDAPDYEPLAFKPIEGAEKLVEGYADGPDLRHGGSQAFYRRSDDSVQMPEPSRFASSEEYYSTLLHELAHSTGHPGRLDRGFEKTPAPFGSPDYGKEELIAETAAAFLCAHAGISPAVIENQAAYLQGWLKQLKSDKRLIVTAAGAGQKAADWIRGERTAVSG